jgi:hypothetical protein
MWARSQAEKVRAGRGMKTPAVALAESAPASMREEQGLRQRRIELARGDACVYRTRSVGGGNPSARPVVTSLPLSPRRKTGIISRDTSCGTGMG